MLISRVHAFGSSNRRRDSIDCCLWYMVLGMSNMHNPLWMARETVRRVVQQEDCLDMPDFCGLCCTQEMGRDRVIDHKMR